MQEVQSYILKIGCLLYPSPFISEDAKMLQHTKWLLEETDEDGSQSDSNTS